MRTGSRTVSGSSPLMRGKRVPDEVSDVDRGLIPAHAGKTEERRRAGRSEGAHPRSRRENFVIEIVSMRTPGSSLLMRGKPLDVVGLSHPARLIPAHAGKLWSHAEADQAPELIPAHAGKTRRHRFLPCRRATHPRSRGENDKYWDAVGKSDGSSPLTQGKRCMILPTGRPVRLIPTHAGKTLSVVPKSWAIWAHPRSCGEN